MDANVVCHCHDIARNARKWLIRRRICTSAATGVAAGRVEFRDNSYRLFLRNSQAQATAPDPGQNQASDFRQTTRLAAGGQQCVASLLAATRLHNLSRFERGIR
jgi:hypothetical protein